MKFVVTIDAEEDNWGGFSRTENTVENIERIPSLQQLFDDFNVKPTYFVTYPVASDQRSVSILKGILEKSGCEIGAHCHPWNTPPFAEEMNEKNSMLCNLPSDLQYEKMKFLHETIVKSFGVEPASFRSGRWGFSREVARNLYRLGYKIDSSITPYTDWKRYQGPDFSGISPTPFRFSTEIAPDKSANGPLMEIPATIGFLQKNFSLSNFVLNLLKQKPAVLLRLNGPLFRLGLLNKVWLSPEMSDGKTMIRLAKRMMQNNFEIINLVFHSASLKAGLTPYSKTEIDEKRLIQRLKEFLVFARESGLESVKLSEALGPAMAGLAGQQAKSLKKSHAKKKTILIVFNTVPYPLRSTGIALRYLPILQYLSKRHDVDVIVIGNSKTDVPNAEALKTYCRRMSFVPNPRFNEHSFAKRIATQIATMLPWTPPNSWVIYGSDSITKQIAASTTGIRYDSVVCVGGDLHQYLGDVKTDRIVVDFIDSPSLSAERQVGAFIKSSMLQKYESWKTKQWEAKVIQESAASIYISSVDAQTVPPESTLFSIRSVIPNGISIDTYTCRIENKIKSPNFGFLGDMGYGPNIEAVHWLYEQVFLPLRTELPNLSLYIIGRAPVESVLSLGKKNGVIVTGTVDDIWPYVNAMDLFVFPLWTGAGLKNKVLEAMYAKRSVVTTKIGNEGIDAVSGRDLVICNSASDFQREVLRLLNSPDERESLGRFGHQFVTERFSWDRILQDFEAVITGSTKRRTVA